MIIRGESECDFAAIHAVVGEAFESAAHADLVAAIRRSREYRPELTFVAVEDDEIVGHVMVDGCIVRNEHGDTTIVMLSPLAVAPNHQRHGIGTALIEAAVGAADAAGEPLVVLEGDPGYYGARGFEPSGKYRIQLPIPDWAPRAASQVRILSSYDAQDPALHGRVVYPPAFDDFAAALAAE